jgi:hypothetical protein
MTPEEKKISIAALVLFLLLATVFVFIKYSKTKTAIVIPPVPVPVPVKATVVTQETILPPVVEAPPVAVLTMPVIPATVLPVEVGTVLATTPVVTNNVTTGADGKSYCTSLPAPYNTIPVTDFINGGNGTVGGLGYIFYVSSVYASGIKLYSFIPAYSSTDTFIVDYITSQEGAHLKFIINQSGAIIFGSF